MPSSFSGPTVVVVPPALALLPEHAGLTDPVADLRAAVTSAVRDLLDARDPQAAGDGARVVVLAAGPTDDDVRRGAPASAGERVAAALLAGTPYEVVTSVPSDARAVLVLANGSAARGEKAPGHLDERAHAYDADLGAALGAAGAGPDATALADLDTALGDALWAEVATLPALGAYLAAQEAAGLAWTSATSYDADPFGVQYWVVRLTATPPPRG